MNIPTFASLINQKLIVPSNKKPYLAIDEHFLQDILAPLLERVDFHSQWYLIKYPDVDAAIKNGIVKSAEEHYRKFGYFENRLPKDIQVNESFYLEEYPDIKEAVNAKVYETGQQHFELIGFREGRIPYAGFKLSEEKIILPRF